MSIYNWSPVSGSFGWPSGTKFFYGSKGGDSLADINAASGFNQIPWILQWHAQGTWSGAAQPIGSNDITDEYNWSILQSSINDLRLHYGFSSYSFSSFTGVLKSSLIAELREALDDVQLIQINPNAASRVRKTGVDGSPPIEDQGAYDAALDDTPFTPSGDAYVGQAIDQGGTFDALIQRLMVSFNIDEFFGTTLSPLLASLVFTGYNHNINNRNYTIEVYKSNGYFTSPSPGDLWGPAFAGEHNKNLDTFVGSDTTSNLDASPSIGLNTGVIDTSANVSLFLCEDEDAAQITPLGDPDNELDKISSMGNLIGLSSYLELSF